MYINYIKKNEKNLNILCSKCMCVLMLSKCEVTKAETA